MFTAHSSLWWHLFNFFETHCENSNNARWLPSQCIASPLTTLCRLVATHCVCTSIVCSHLCFPANPQTKTTMSNFHPVYVIWHSFVQMLKAIYLVSSSLYQPTQHHDSTHKEWLTGRSLPYWVWHLIFDLIKYYLSCKFHEVKSY